MKDIELANAWSSENVLDYYCNHRNKVEDLYKSEKVFLIDAIKRSNSVLDVGCATGGFSKVVEFYNPNIFYTGVDISNEMINKAKELYPACQFEVLTDHTLPFANNNFDLVMCFGVLHMTERWKKLLNEGWRVSKKGIVFDLRLVENEGICNPKISYQKLDFNNKWDGRSIAPYVLVGIDELGDVLSDFNPKIKSIKSYGYWHSISEMTVSPYNQACMTSFYLTKEKEKSNRLNWDLPIEIPQRIKDNIL